jgi:hypothetical protein
MKKIDIIVRLTTIKILEVNVGESRSCVYKTFLIYKFYTFKYKIDRIAHILY